ncbi:hypothetical protein WIS01_04765 [Clostridioides difficile]
MESRGYKEDLKKMILDMAHKELESYVSQKEQKNTLKVTWIRLLIII